MKRAGEEAGADSNTVSPKPKRRKASQACASCRRHKTRCELPDDIGNSSDHRVQLRCHRCNVLNVECSFKTSNIIHVRSKSNSESTSTILLPVNLDPPVVFVSTPDIPREPPSSAPAASTRDLRIEDLLPRPQSPVGPISSFDWTAAPMLAIRELANCRESAATQARSSSSTNQSSDESLSTILTRTQITWLLQIFETRYTRWVCQLQTISEQDGVLDLVRCTIASRHLDPITQTSVAPRLYRLTDNILFKHLFHPIPSLESIGALIILSLWSPLQCPAQDSRLLVASAISMGMNFRLKEASAHAVRLQEQGLTDSQVYEEAIQRSRLWILLSTTESMVCLGTRRDSLSSRSAFDYRVLSTGSVGLLAQERDLRINIQGKLMDLAEKGSKITLKGPQSAEIECFYLQVQDVLTRMDCLYTPMAPLPVVSQHDPFAFHMLLLQYHGSRLLVAQHALREMRTVISGSNATPSLTWLRAQYHGTSIAMCLGRDSIKSAQSVLSAVHSVDANLLVAVPDSIFTTVSFAATWLVVANFSMHQLNCTPLGAACDRLISMTVELLSRLALGPTHILTHYAHIIATLVDLWERQSQLPVPSLNCSSTTPTESPASFETSTLPSLTEWSSANLSNNSNIFMDPEFWTSFMDNLDTTQSPWS
ncbi:uncharacterized protein BT62DRAFT_1004357 [Guyanagaster necrorhizus]|uniref:Zn(2)-C6 fungal-type domain-containing protein n=1 Tax=Guyanagaster necrorhizus TaxID=856835 RepID=A0A9P7VWA0_9AGAR|nr:uncharacterized protein BT62DRAFT_1004357 [Guyanagaster necrorhizus MCA 3950]KAG7447600.1 hypothetical protein BT62DRAFT_1004357 [Guyanagaster necrorhizus MCA 3950]